MDIKVCRFCRKNFQGFSHLCPKCVQELDQKYLVLRNHLDEKPNCTVHDLAEATAVDEKAILFLVREGRLILKAASSDIKCIKCGKAVVSGKYCDACKTSIMNDLSHSGADTKTAVGNRPAQPGLKPQDSNGKERENEKIELHTRFSRR